MVRLPGFEDGGGKTTICHLIPNFYQCTEGYISIDGIPINEITFDSLRRNIGIVQQDVFLFNGSIKDNILYGKLDATMDEVILAAKRANIHDYITSLDHGYDTEKDDPGWLTPGRFAYSFHGRVPMLL